MSKSVQIAVSLPAVSLLSTVTVLCRLFIQGFSQISADFSHTLLEWGVNPTLPWLHH